MEITTICLIIILVCLFLLLICYLLEKSHRRKYEMLLEEVVQLEAIYDAIQQGKDLSEILSLPMTPRLRKEFNIMLIESIEKGIKKSQKELDDAEL